jgi:TonB family protein
LPLVVDASTAKVKVYTVGPGVRAPELLPFTPPSFSDEKCRKKVNGVVKLSILVDTKGLPLNIMFLQPLGSDLDKFALLIVAADRFKPGTNNGQQVVVAETVNVSMQACIDEKKDDTGKKTYTLRMRSQPVQQFGLLTEPPEEAVLLSNIFPTYDIGNDNPRTLHVGGSVSAPVPLYTPEAHYTPEAKKAEIKGKCLVSFIVDQQGMPKNIRIIQSLDTGLDQNAMDAVAKYRFKPAMRNGEPVSVVLTSEVNFQLY